MIAFYVGMAIVLVVVVTGTILHIIVGTKFRTAMIAKGRVTDEDRRLYLTKSIIPSILTGGVTCGAIWLAIEIVFTRQFSLMGGVRVVAGMLIGTALNLLEVYSKARILKARLREDDPWRHLY